ncbi:MAG: Mrp/NBP35 family ATP-binding protein [Spirochaetia bacterium]|nr:Mrp/NBP35 family ATP-binding protein [Spirochaetia bacterium]
MNENDNLKSKIDAIVKVLEQTKNPATNNSLLEDQAVEEISPLGEDNILITLNLQVDKKTAFAVEASIRTELSRHNIDSSKVKINYKTEPAATHGSENTMPPRVKKLENVKHVIAIASGKGGVGKSTVSSNLAAAMAKKGYKTGLIDADIYGPSIGKMFGHPGKVELQILDEKKIIPLEKHGIKVMSFAFLLDESQAVIWRGPMLGKALEQMLFDVKWGELDFLIIDLPPGTGDTQLSLAQFVALEGALIVTTPQDVAVQDAMRAVSMFEKINIPIMGIIENMTEFLCPHCGEGTKIFSEGGGENLSAKSGAALLGKIPLSIALMSSAEKGKPAVIENLEENENEIIKKSHAAVIEAYDNIAVNIEKKIRS